MKKLLVCLSLLSILTSCGDDDEKNQSFGQLSVILGVDITATPAGRTENVETEDFLVIILNEDDTEYLRFERAVDLPDQIDLPTGNYRVVTHSENDLPAAFENPYFYGETPIFSIDADELKPITVTARLANVIVAVEYSANVVNSFQQYSTRVRNSQNDELIFSESETREGYFKVDPLTVTSTLSFTKSDGSTGVKYLSGVIADPQPQTRYLINIDASLQDGEVAVTIVLDDTMSEIDVTLSGESEGVCAILDEFDCLCYSDTDGDGFGSSNTIISADSDCNDAFESLLSTDCNDTDSTINPDAIDVPGDGIDQNCDGMDEENPTSCALEVDGDGNCLCHQDGDGDGFGSNQLVISPDATCDGAGESMNNADCDDTNSNIRPGGDEGIGNDNNCDGLYLCYQDLDRDGHANGSSTILISQPCTVGSGGLLTSGNDCNDYDASTYPGAYDIPNNGIDENCDGFDDPGEVQ